MKKILILSTIALLSTSCRKEVPVIQTEQFPKNESRIQTSNSVQAVPISYQETYEFQSTVWNSCSQEFVDLSGTGRIQIRGMISNNKITYILHYNAANVKGTGQTTGTEYIATSTFNYSNTDNFNNQLVYQQRASTHYIATTGEANFTVDNNWHLTINANGEVTFFFTTGGDVISCQ